MNVASLLKTFPIILIILLSKTVAAQNENAILGIWMTEGREAKVEIYKSTGKYFGKMIWGNDIYASDGKTLKKDLKNPDVKLRNRTLLNIVMLSDFTYEKGAWIDGKIYDSRSGKTYSGLIKLQNGKLELRGYMGFSAFGKSTIWTSVSK